MIIFEKVRFKNFGSFGNTMTEIELNKNKSTLICGTNGSGKSFAFLDSITFALFGKPFRKINIPQLVNSINEKGCLVEIEFSRGLDKFLVRRGISPRILEIYKNGDLLNQDAKSLDYQVILEQQILKMNYKTFTQVVILGSSAFIPFMQLSTADRRNVIENILDIDIFSTMNAVLKGKILALKESIRDINTKLEIERNKINVQTTYINTLEKKNSEDNEDKESLIMEHEAKIHNLHVLIGNINPEISQDHIQTAIDDIKTQNNILKQHNKNISARETNKQQIQKEIKFFKDNQVCPTCSQGISDKLKKDKIISHNTQITDLDISIEEIQRWVSSIENHLIAHEIALTQNRQELVEVNAAKKEIEAFTGDILRIRKSISKSSLTGDITAEKDKLNQMAGGLEVLISERTGHAEDILYHELANDLLRDGGVKTKIIKYYLPHMNKYINKYLSAMDFFVQFNMDEEFNEKIKSRYRDDFTYMNFSEGEKMRIDLALLLAWREIARLKNSVSCNLLILDEVFDSSLDSVGMDELMKLLKVVSDTTNVYVISHKSDQLVDKFSTIVSFDKKNNFSRMINN